MELTHSQYGALVDAYVQARIDASRAAEVDSSFVAEVRAEAEMELEDAATAAYEQIAEDPRESTGWNSEVWDNLVVGLGEEGHSSEEVDRIARRAAEIAGVPLPTLP